MSDNGRDAPRSANVNFRMGVRSPPANLQPKDLQKLELSYIELNKERAKQKEWKKLIRDMVFQRGKVPLLLAVEAGNQSMVRELLSAQTAEQLKVTLIPKFIDKKRIILIYSNAVKCGLFFPLMLFLHHS
jgi:hypothetical protein